MIRGIYYDRHKHHRLLSVDEIAATCRLSTVKVRQLIDSKLLHTDSKDQDLVETTDVIWFLIRNNMVVPACLLPPRAGKILFIGGDENIFRQKEQIIDHVSRIFAESCSLVLAESALIGPPADLTIMTFCPNVAVIILQLYDRRIKTTLDLLASMATIKTILFLDQATKIALDYGLATLPANLVLSCDMPADKLNNRLRSLLTE